MYYALFIIFLVSSNYMSVTFSCIMSKNGCWPPSNVSQDDKLPQLVRIILTLNFTHNSPFSLRNVANIANL